MILHQVGRERVVIDPAGRRQAIVDVIAGARRDLRLSLFRCDDRPVVDALLAARARGVAVTVLMTRRARRFKARLRVLRHQLRAHGITIDRSPHHVCYHAKLLIADARLAVVTSANLTARCLTRTSDFTLVTSEAAVVAGLTRLFEHDRGAATAAAPPPCDRLIVGPDRARAAFTALLAGAGRSIRLVDHKLRDPQCLAILAERQAAGVDVRVLAGPTVGTRPAHGKLCVIDDRVAVLGSTALTRTALDARRELSIRVDRPELVAALAAHFDAACWPPRVRHRAFAELLASRTASVARIATPGSRVA